MLLVTKSCQASSRCKRRRKRQKSKKTWAKSKRNFKKRIKRAARSTKESKAKEMRIWLKWALPFSTAKQRCTKCPFKSGARQHKSSTSWTSKRRKKKTNTKNRRSCSLKVTIIFLFLFFLLTSFANTKQFYQIKQVPKIKKNFLFLRQVCSWKR